MVWLYVEKKGVWLGVMLLLMLEKLVVVCGSWCWGILVWMEKCEVVDVWLCWVMGCEIGVVLIVWVNGVVFLWKLVFVVFLEYEWLLYLFFWV